MNRDLDKMGTKKWAEIRGSRDPGDPEVQAFRDAIDDAVTLGELRTSREVSQVELARRLGIAQPNVSRIERREDVYLSSLREYVEALGGRLEVAAVFDGQRVPIATWSEGDQPKAHHPVAARG